MYVICETNSMDRVVNEPCEVHMDKNFAYQRLAELNESSVGVRWPENEYEDMEIIDVKEYLYYTIFEVSNKSETSKNTLHVYNEDQHVDSLDLLPMFPHSIAQEIIYNIKYAGRLDEMFECLKNAFPTMVSKQELQDYIENNFINDPKWRNVWIDNNVNAFVFEVNDVYHSGDSLSLVENNDNTREFLEKDCKYFVQYENKEGANYIYFDSFEEAYEGFKEEFKKAF